MHGLLGNIFIGPIVALGEMSDKHKVLETLSNISPNHRVGPVKYITSQNCQNIAWAKNEYKITNLFWLYNEM